MDRTSTGQPRVDDVTVAAYQLRAYTAPEIIEDSTEDWIQYGVDNNYYQYLIDLFHGSPTNNAAITSISELIYGQGLEATRADRHLQGYLEFKKMFANEDVRRVCKDFKLLGSAVFQLTKNKNATRYLKARHWPANTVRPGKANEKGEITHYYYAADWSKVDQQNPPKKIAAFGHDQKATESFIVIKQYSTGSFYFTPPDYQGGTQYADLECEISNYHNSNVRNGMSPGMIINFNNGIPEKRKRTATERKVLEKFGGSSNSGRVLMSWNADKDSAATIEPVQLSDAHNQYQFLSDEASNKILIAHRVTTRQLFGITTGSGFSNNAEELKNGLIAFDNMVIRPKQDTIIGAIDEVLAANGVSLDLYFKTLQPLEFTDLSGQQVDQATQEKETGINLSLSKGEAMSNDAEQDWLTHLDSVGHTIDESKWDLVDEQEAGNDDGQRVMGALFTLTHNGTPFDVDAPDEQTAKAFALEHGYEFSGPTEGKYEMFKRFADPNERSKDDKGIYLIRYRYAPMSHGGDSRVFCKNMVAGAKSGLVYRREDIDEMGEAGVNAQFSARGESTYSIWLYKGGVNCHHQWFRLTYKRKEIKGKIIPLTPVEKSQNVRLYKKTYERVSSASANAAGVPFNPPGWPVASTKTKNLPNQGRVN